MSLTINTQNGSIDQRQIAMIVRQVIARLRETTQSNSEPASTVTLTEQVISVASLDELPAGTAAIHVLASAVVTPAAMDEAKARKIEIQTAGQPLDPNLITKQSQKRSKVKRQIQDLEDPERLDAIRRQLKIRRIELCPRMSVVCTASPAAEVHRRCAAGDRAVMIGTVADVQRFGKEWNPNVWVLDMSKLNLIAAVNAIAMIGK